MYTATMLRSILPEIMILVLGLGILVVEPFWKEESRRNIGWLTVGGLFAAILISLLFGQPGAPVSTFGGTLRFDWLGFFFKMLFMFSAAVTALLFMDHEKVGRRGEAYLLLLASTLGMNLMAASADLVLLYLAIETTSIPLYVLAGFLLSDDSSAEAGFKYLLFGAMASAVLLYGFSLLFGVAGTTDLYKMVSSLAAAPNSFLVILGVIFLVIVGIGFKVSIVPFHFWAPDVYQGSPTPVAGFLSTASKAAGFAVLVRLFFIAFPGFSAPWTMVFAVLSVVTMTVGNLLALPQTNLKRMLAYSSIAHAGYALIGVVAYQGANPAVSQFGGASVIFYMVAYVVTNLTAFGVVMAVERVVGSDEYSAYSGLSRRSPGLALIMLAAFLSLAGMPPFGGFVAKIFVFAAGMRAGYAWLVLAGILNSIIGMYYYLNVMKYVYLYRLPGEDEEQQPILLTRPSAIALITLVVGVVLVGTVFAPWFAWSNAAALNLF